MSQSDQWTFATGEQNGTIAIYRIRLEAPEFATKASFPQFLVVSWTYSPTSDQGLPAPEVLDRMLELEKVLQAVFEEARQGFLSVIVTNYGLREWLWYVRDPISTMELVNEALAELEPFPIQFSFEEDDPEWSVFEAFRNPPDSSASRPSTPSGDLYGFL